jgi:hypothetical protein
LISHIKGRTYSEGGREYGAEEDIWVHGGGSNNRMEVKQRYGFIPFHTRKVYGGVEV